MDLGLRWFCRKEMAWKVFMTSWVSGLKDVLYGLFARVPVLRGLGQAALVLFGARSLLRLIEGYRPDVVVSTYPAATSVLGYLRRRGRLAVMAACSTGWR